jgi:hypothetical protein
MQGCQSTRVVSFGHLLAKLTQFRITLERTKSVDIPMVKSAFRASDKGMFGKILESVEHNKNALV